MKPYYFVLAATAFVASALVTGAVQAEGVEFQAEASDGRKVVGTVASLDGESVTLTTPEGPVSLPISDLLSLKSQKSVEAPAGEPAAWIRLIDGSTVVAAQWTLEGDEARIVLLDGRKVEVPRRAIESIRLQAAPEEVAAQWTRLVETPHDGDVIVVRKDDHLDFLRGIVRGANEETVEFEMDGDVLPVRRTRLFGVVLLQPAGRELPTPMGRVTDSSGSVWAVKSVALSDQLEWTTPAGVTVRGPTASVVEVDFSAGNLVYLADLEPISADWQPFFPMDTELASRREFFQPRRNRGLETESLELGGTEYQRGLAMHSRSEVVFRLPDAMARLKAKAGIDDRVRPHGHVVLVIEGDGKTLFEQALSGADPPVEIDLDITGVRRLTFLCDFGEGMDIADHLNLCNLRVIR